MKNHFSVLDQNQVDTALGVVWRGLDELTSELERLDKENDHLLRLKRARDDVWSVRTHYDRYNVRMPKGFFARRDIEADDDVRFIAGAAHDLADLIGQAARKEIEALRHCHA